MKHVDSSLHVRGESRYVDDVPAPDGMLHAAVIGSPVARGTLKELRLEQVHASPGVVRVITAEDVPGDNSMGAIIMDELALADSELSYIGQPVALVLAETHEQARRAAARAEVVAEELPPVVDPRVAHAAGDFIEPPRTFAIGDVDAAWSDCDFVVEGECEIAGQEHLYLETNRARAVWNEGERITVYSSTQSPHAVQRNIARVLGVPQHAVEVDVKRLGGGFGGKEDQATVWAVLAALGAVVTRRPVQLVLHRIDDLVMTGKRHPYSADFKLGMKYDGSIVAYDCKLYQNSGAKADLSPAVLERTLFHATNAYFVPNARIYAACCRTNLHPHTAFRGFGGPQGMFVIEAALAKAAEKLGVPREQLQRQNLLKKGDSFPYGQQAEEDHAIGTWQAADDKWSIASIRKSVDEFNASSSAKKRGMAVMPVVFGISFTKTFLNQASSLLHVYTDGSVAVSTGGVEMGQGVSTNMATIAQRELGIGEGRVRVESTNTTRIANMSPSAASATTDLNGHATILACRQLLDRLYGMMARELDRPNPMRFAFRDERLEYDGEDTGWTWERVVSHAYISRVGLSAHGYYATPGLSFDKKLEQGRPFAYHVYGTAITEVTVDCLRGTYSIDAVRLMHNLGRELNPTVDEGQVIGGLAQGIGWMTLEELAYSDDGRLLSHALSTYKAPDVYFTPKTLELEFLESENVHGPRGSKAVGEPPFMYGIGAYFALREAVRAFRSDRDAPFRTPATPERVLMDLHADRLIAADEVSASAERGGGELPNASVAESDA